MIRMKAKFGGVCAGCANGIRAGTMIWWDAKKREVKHESCKALTAKKKKLAKKRGRPPERPALGSVRFVS